MAKITWKEFGLSVLMASGVILGIALLPKLPLLSNLYGLGFMSKGLTGYLTLGQALFGGVSAMAIHLLIAQTRK